MSLFLLLLYVCLYVIMALIVWFDKRDVKVRHGTKGSEAQSLNQAAENGSENDPKSFLDFFVDALN